MSPLRMPQHLADPPHVDTGEAILKFELLEELDASLAQTERRVEETLGALREHDARGGDRDRRAELLNSAAEAVWRLFVQHEACDVCDHQELVARYRIPPEVLARIGAAH
jgi:hypothetical protein